MRMHKLTPRSRCSGWWQQLPECSGPVQLCPFCLLQTLLATEGAPHAAADGQADAAADAVAGGGRRLGAAGDRGGAAGQGLARGAAPRGGGHRRAAARAAPALDGLGLSAGRRSEPRRQGGFRHSTVPYQGWLAARPLVAAAVAVLLLAAVSLRSVGRAREWGGQRPCESVGWAEHEIGVPKRTSGLLLQRVISGPGWRPPHPGRGRRCCAGAVAGATLDGLGLSGVDLATTSCHGDQGLLCRTVLVAAAVLSGYTGWAPMALQSSQKNKVFAG